jgi:hypothetical protein
MVEELDGGEIQVGANPTDYNFGDEDNFAPAIVYDFGDDEDGWDEWHVNASDW